MKFLGSNFSSVPIQTGDSFIRPSAGGGGFGDPLERPAEEVLEDVIDGYVSLKRAEEDYGVVIDAVDAELDDFRIDFAATDKKRAWISDNRQKWLEEDPATIAAAYKKGEVDMLDVIRRHGVILDWGTGELFETTTAQYRELMARRSSSHWG